ncbi:hypothetical protein LTS18_011328 [Coniosporium uncinatum]|uniref:Uncharacterized protein n=1 Tax=Coniosporium uncinatum TaxID=93489 RepID=A0ACC3D9K8_9PEZI|nr:hypothetical protein LTS18_011328 [Coniosporium uncinatum]
MPSRQPLSEDADQLLHVFDLPQLYSKPSAAALLSALTLATSQPPSWDVSDAEDSRPGSGTSTPSSLHAKRRILRKKPVQRVDPEGLTAYLTRIIGSDLQWLPTEEQKEEVWETASLRLSERSGRTGMGAMSRSLYIPVSEDDEVEIVLHEPALTSDNLGFKTWASSYLLAKRLHTLDFPALSRKNDLGMRVLELGSGTGLVGMAAAAVFGASVTLTDLPDIEGNLKRNVDANSDVIMRSGGTAYSGVLDWRNPDVILSEGLHEPEKFPVILAADSLYSDKHPQLLVQTIDTWLAKDANARLAVELPLRDEYAVKLHRGFRKTMSTAGLHILEQGKETGYDDWDSGDGDSLQQVQCWWSVWGWK